MRHTQGEEGPAVVGLRGSHGQIGHRAHKGSRDARPHSSTPRCTEVERAFNRLKGWRAAALRYDKAPATNRAGVILVCIVPFWAPVAPDPSDTRR